MRIIDDFEIAESGEKWCGVKHEDGFYCTRLADHKDDHVAMGALDRPPCMRWPQ